MAKSFLPMALLVLAGCAIVLVNAISLPTHMDAYQYLSSAVFWGDPDIRIYRDFMHSQPPYQPAFLGLWIQALDIDGVGLYLEARLFNALWSMLFLVCLARLLTVLSGSLLWAALGVVAIFTSTYMDLPLRMVRNDMLPLFLTTLALLVCLPALRGDPDRASALRYAVAAALVGIATMTKQSYAFVAVGLFVFSLVASYPTWQERIRMAALPVAIGGGLAALPGLIVILQNWHNASFALFEFHRTAHLGNYVADHAVGVTLNDRVRWMVRALMDLSAAVLLVWTVALAGLLAWRHRGGRPLPAETVDGGLTFQRRVLWLCTICAVFVCFSFFLARPLHWQYAAPLLPFAVSIMAVLSSLALRGRAAPDRLWGGLVPAAGIALVLAGGVGLVKHNEGNTWTMSALDHFIHVVRPPLPGAEGQAYARRPIGERKWLEETMGGFTAQIDTILLPGARPGLRVATDMLAYPLEAGLGIYPELASMPFFYDRNDDIDPERLARLRGVGPATTRAWMERNDVRAVLIGEENDWNKGAEMLAYAEARGLACYTIDMRGAFLVDAARFYVDPALTARPGDCPGPASLAGRAAADADSGQP